MYIKFLLISGFLATSLCADNQTVLELLAVPTGYIEVATQEQPMPELDDSKIGGILTRYYVEGLGGTENWDKISSLKLIGMLRTADGEFNISAFQKKPNFTKMNISRNHQTVVMSYDGKVAWQRLPNSAEAELMEPAQAREFIHHSRFGNHLIYPYARGKTIAYVDTVPFRGNICHRLRVTLDTDFQVDYYIDIRTYLERKVDSTDLRTGKVTTLIFEDYIRELGMPVATKVITLEGETRISVLELFEVKVNSGVMPWMFKMPD